MSLTFWKTSWQLRRRTCCLPEYTWQTLPSQWREQLPVHTWRHKNTTLASTRQLPVAKCFQVQKLSVLLCHKHGVEELWRYPVCIEGTRWKRAETWGGKMCLKYMKKRKKAAMQKGGVYLPLRMKTMPAKQVILALLFSLPPILVHFIPTSENTEPKKPKHIAAIISPLQAWM